MAEQLNYDVELDQQHQNPQWGDVCDDKGRLSARKQVSPRLVLVITMHPYMAESPVDGSDWRWSAEDTESGAIVSLLIGAEFSAKTPGRAMDLAEDAYRRHCEAVVFLRQERAAAAERKALARAANLDALRVAVAGRRGVTD